jgi:hypothetical protein
MNIQDLDFLKLFAAINTDAFITGVRSLEGMTYTQTIKFLNEFLNDKNKGAPALLPPAVLGQQQASFNHLQKRLATMLVADGEIKDLVAVLKKTINNHNSNEGNETNIDETIKKSLNRLTQGVIALPLKPQGKQPESVLMPGGWTGPGHAIVYEFQKDEQGNLLFLLYNAGAGLNFHEKIISPEDNKERYKTVKCFKIPAQNVKLENLSYFIAELVKPQVLPLINGLGRQKSKEIKYNEEILYNQVFTKIAEIGGEEIPVEQLGPAYNEIASIGQRAGTCAEKSLHQLIKNDVPDKKIAKLIIFTLKLRSIELCLEKIKPFEGNPGCDEYAKYLSQLEPAVANLAGILLNQKDIPANLQDKARDYIRAVNKLSQATEGVVKNYTQDIAKISENITLSQTDTQADPGVAIQADPSTQLIKPKPYNLAKQDYVAAAIADTQVSIPALNTFIGNIENLIKDGFTKDAEQQIFSYLTTMPLNKAYYAAVSRNPATAIEYINCMHDVLSKYFYVVLLNQQHTLLNPKSILAILCATQAMELMYENPSLSLIAKPGGINKFFSISDNSFFCFKTGLRLNAYLGVDSPELDARIKEMMISPPPPSGYDTRICLENIKIYLESNPKLNFYLATLYDDKVKAGDVPNFTAHEQQIINRNRYQAAIAYLHYFERFPGNFLAEAQKVTLFKKMKTEVMNIVSTLKEYDVINKAGTNLQAFGHKWASQNYPQRNDLDENLIDWGGFELNKEKTIQHFKKINKEAIAESLARDFSIVNDTEKKEKARNANEIYSSLSGFSKIEPMKYESGVWKPAKKIYEVGEKTEETSLYQDLFYLRTDPNVQFLTTLDYFMDRLELFSSKLSVEGKPDRDNELKKDIQQYLRRNIFQPGVLIDALENNPRCLAGFHAFIQKGILYFSEGPQITDSLLYFYQLQVDVNSYVLKMQDKNIPANLKNDFEKMKKDTQALQGEMLKKLEKIDMSKIIGSSDRYDIAKMKVQLQLESENKDPQKLFNFFIECCENYREVKTDCNEEREAYKEVTDLCLLELEKSKDAFAGFVINWIQSKNPQLIEEIQKLPQQGQYPYLYWEKDGKRLVAIDLTEGLILIEGKYLSYPPGNLVNSTLYQEILGKELPRLEVSICDKKDAQGRVQGLIKKYEIIDPAGKSTGYFLETNNRKKPWVYRTKKTVNKVEGFFEKKVFTDGVGKSKNTFSLVLHPDEDKTTKIEIDLPESFYGKETLFWGSLDNNKILIERNSERFLCDKDNQGNCFLQELDQSNNPTGYVLSTHKNTDLDNLFGKFEDKEFTEIFFKYNLAGVKEKNFKVKFPRYNLELHGSWDAKSHQWLIHPSDKPNLILDNTAVRMKPLLMNGLMFKETGGTEKQVIYTPNQVYYADIEVKEKQMKEADFSTVYHHPILDTTNVDKRLETNGWGVAELGIPRIPRFEETFPKGSVTYAGSEKYFSYELEGSDKDEAEKFKELKGRSTTEKLYLAYLNLINIQPKEALKNIRSIIKTGGLKGTAEELEIIEKIMDGAPRLADRIASPEFIAVRIHVLSLVSELMENKKLVSKSAAERESTTHLFSVPLSKNLTEDTPDQYFKKRHCEKLEKFEQSLPALMKEQFSSSLKTENNIPKLMRLPRSIEYAVMSRMDINAEDDATLLLQARYQDLKNWYRVRELVHIQQNRFEAEKGQARIGVLTQKMQKGKTVQALVKHFEGMQPSITLKDRYNQVNPHQLKFADLIATGFGNNNNKQYVALTLGVSDEDFLRNLIPAYNLAKSIDQKDVVEKNKLRDFLTKRLQANALVPSDKPNSIIPTWASVLLTVLEQPNSFTAVNLEGFNEQVDHWGTKYNNNNTRFEKFLVDVFNKAKEVMPRREIPMKGYQDRPEPKKLKLKVFSEPTKQDKFKPEPIKITLDSNTQNPYLGVAYEDFIQLAGLEDFNIKVKELYSTTEKQVTEKKEGLKKTMGVAPFRETVDLKRSADEEIGAIKNNEAIELYKITKAGFAQNVVRQKVIDTTESLIKPLDGRIEATKKVALDLANQGPTNDPALIKKYRDKLAAGKRSHLKMSDLNRLFVLADKNEYRRVTGLNNDVETLHNTMAQLVNFEILKTQYEKIKKDLEELKQKDFSDPLKEIEVTQLGRTLATRNTVAPNGEADFQFFQKEEKILMSPLQKFYVDKLLNRDSKTGSFSNEVIQLIMGGGKSKVIAPLSALKKADGTNLVIFQVKNSLLEVNFADMERASGELFNQKAIMFKFDRNSPATGQDLKQLYKKFYNASIDKNYIVTSGVSLQSLELKYLETLANPPVKPVIKPGEAADITAKNEEVWKKDRKEWEKQLKWFEKSLLLLKNKGDRIIDEVHDELDPTKELNYTTGSPTLPRKEDVKLSIGLFYFLSKVKIGTDAKDTAFELITNNKLITDKAKLDSFMEEIAKSLVSDGSPENPILSITKKLALDGAKQKLLTDYFLNKSDKILSEFEVKSLSELEKNQLAFLKFELSKILPFTLSKNYNEHYGPSRLDNVNETARRLAIPYQAPNTPNEKARFGQFVESLNYSIQMNIIEPFSTELVAEVIQSYLDNARVELLDSPNGQFINTKSSREFERAFHCSLKEISMMNKKELAECYKNFSTDLNFKKEVLAAKILPLVKINPVVLSSNSQNLAEMTRTTQGMTGTPWNHKAFHEDIQFKEFEGLGTDGETIDLLKNKKSPADTSVRVCDEAEYQSATALLTSLLIGDQIKNIKPIKNANNVRAIIDVGAMFKKENSNLAVAKAIGDFYYKNNGENDKKLGTTTKFVLYVDNKDNQLYAYEIATKNIIKLGKSDEKEVSSVLKCSPEERFTYYDQARITGTDIKQAPYANALVTISDKTTQSSFLQGVKRMRQFTNNQSVTVVEPRYIERRVHEGQSGSQVEQVLAFVNRNQADKCLQIHFKGASQRFKNALRADLLKIIYDCKKQDGKLDYDKKSELLKKFDSIFSKEYKPEHFKNYGAVETLISSEDYFEGLRSKYEKQWLELLKSAKIEPAQDAILGMEHKLEFLKQKAIEACDAQILSKPKVNAAKPEESEGGEDLAAEVENELENELENEEEINIETEKVFFNDQNPKVNMEGAFKFDSGRAVNLNFGLVALNNSCLFKRVDQKNTFKFDDNIFFSNRQHKTVNDNDNYYDKFKPIQVMMMIASKNNPKSISCVLLTKDEAKQYTINKNEKLSKEYPDHHIWFVSPSNLLLHGTPPTTLPETYGRILEQARFVNGDLAQLANQKESFSWLTEDLEKKKKYLETKIMPYLHGKTASYKKLKSRLDISGKIIQYILDNPFEDHSDDQLSQKYNTYDKLPEAIKKPIKELVEGLEEINKIHAADCNDVVLTNNQKTNELIAKYDEETQKNIKHHKTNVLDKRTVVINTIKAGNNLDMMLSEAYKDLDLNFSQKTKSLIEIAIENKKPQSVLFLVKNKKIKLENKNNKNKSNLELIIEYTQNPVDLNAVLDAVGEDTLLDYIKTEKEELNLFYLAAKHNNLAVLKYIDERYLYPKEYRGNSKELAAKFDSINKQFTQKHTPEFKKLFGSALLEGSLLYNFVNPVKYITGKIKAYLADTTKPIDFDVPPLSTVNVKMFDQKFITDIVLQNPQSDVFNYLAKRNALKSPPLDMNKLMSDVMVFFKNNPNENNLKAIIDILLNNQADITAAFFEAVKLNCPEAILTHLSDKTGINWDEKNNDDNTILAAAISANNLVALQHIQTKCSPTQLGNMIDSKNKAKKSAMDLIKVAGVNQTIKDIITKIYKDKHPDPIVVPVPVPKPIIQPAEIVPTHPIVNPAPSAIANALFNDFKVISHDFFKPLSDYQDDFNKKLNEVSLEDKNRFDLIAAELQNLVIKKPSGLNQENALLLFTGATFTKNAPVQPNPAAPPKDYLAIAHEIMEAGGKATIDFQSIDDEIFVTMLNDNSKTKEEFGAIYKQLGELIDAQLKIGTTQMNNALIMLTESIFKAAHPAMPIAPAVLPAPPFGVGPKAAVLVKDYQDIAANILKEVLAFTNNCKVKNINIFSEKISEKTDNKHDFDEVLLILKKTLFEHHNIKGTLSNWINADAMLNAAVFKPKAAGPAQPQPQPIAPFVAPKPAAQPALQQKDYDTLATEIMVVVAQLTQQFTKRPANGDPFSDEINKRSNNQHDFNQIVQKLNSGIIDLFLGQSTPESESVQKWLANAAYQPLQVGPVNPQPGGGAPAFVPPKPAVPPLSPAETKALFDDFEKVRAEVEVIQKAFIQDPQVHNHTKKIGATCKTIFYPIDDKYGFSKVKKLDIKVVIQTILKQATEDPGLPEITRVLNTIQDAGADIEPETGLNVAELLVRTWSLAEQDDPLNGFTDIIINCLHDNIPMGGGCLAGISGRLIQPYGTLIQAALNLKLTLHFPDKPIVHIKPLVPVVGPKPAGQQIPNQPPAGPIVGPKPAAQQIPNQQPAVPFVEPKPAQPQQAAPVNIPPAAQAQQPPAQQPPAQQPPAQQPPAQQPPAQQPPAQQPPAQQPPPIAPVVIHVPPAQAFVPGFAGVGQLPAGGGQAAVRAAAGQKSADEKAQEVVKWAEENGGFQISNKDPINAKIHTFCASEDEYKEIVTAFRELLKDNKAAKILLVSKTAFKFDATKLNPALQQAGGPAPGPIQQPVVNQAPPIVVPQQPGPVVIPPAAQAQQPQAQVQQPVVNQAAPIVVPQQPGPVIIAPAAQAQQPQAQVQQPLANQAAPIVGPQQPGPVVIPPAAQAQQPQAQVQQPLANQAPPIVVPQQPGPVVIPPAGQAQQAPVVQQPPAALFMPGFVGGHAGGGGGAAVAAAAQKSAHEKAQEVKTWAEDPKNGGFQISNKDPINAKIHTLCASEDEYKEIVTAFRELLKDNKAAKILLVSKTAFKYDAKLHPAPPAGPGGPGNP